MAITEYSSYDGLGLAELVKKGDVTSAELIEEAISRIEKYNPVLNAVIYDAYDRGRETAKRLATTGKQGPFHGVPFLLKDILGNCEGIPTTAGCKFMTGTTAAHDDTLVARYKAAGLVVLGKTNVPECGILPTTEPELYGPCKNPWNTTHTTGGSSGGSSAPSQRESYRSRMQTTAGAPSESRHRAAVWSASNQLGAAHRWVRTSGT